MTEFDRTAALVQLRNIAEEKWHCEANVVESYLGTSRTEAGDIRWLRLQAFKETRLYRELDTAQRREFDARETITSNPDLASRVREEMQHYALIADLIVQRGGIPPGPREALYFPTDRALQIARARLRNSDRAIDHCISELVEGGGGAMYKVMTGLDSNPADRQIADAFATILHDELEHGPAQFTRLEELATSCAEVQRARDALVAMSDLRLAMRREMFADPTRLR